MCNQVDQRRRDDTTLLYCVSPPFIIMQAVIIYHMLLSEGTRVYLLVLCVQRMRTILSPSIADLVNYMASKIQAYIIKNHF